jgi:GNAT superfamily N-acetyltransferase
VTDPLVDHPRAFTEQVARVLAGTAVDHAHLTGFVNSRFDRFLNQLFGRGRVTPREALEALDRHPGVIWLNEEPGADELGVPEAERIDLGTTEGMTASTEAPGKAPRVASEIGEVRSHEDLDAWHEVYREVFQSDARGRNQWHDLHEELGPGGEGSLTLFLARVNGSPAATGAVFFDAGWAGLYCFTTRERMRGLGLASAIVGASHAAARERGIARALLHATTMGSPVYASAGYEPKRSMPLLIVR